MIKKFIYVLRWLLVIPVGIIGIYLTLITSLYVISYINSLCPNDFYSGECYRQWTSAIRRYVFPCTSALLAVVLPYLTAPDYRKIIASLAYAVGLSVALWIALELDTWKEFATAAAVGTLSLVYILLRTPKKVVTPHTQDTSQVRDHSL